MELGIKRNSGLTYALKYAAKVLKQGIGSQSTLFISLWGGGVPSFIPIQPLTATWG